LAAPAQLPFPAWLLAVDFAGALLLALGIAGLNGVLGPALAAPVLAWSLIALGAVMAIAAAAMILLHIRDRAASGR
jgi:hypothetical protein